MLYWPHDWCDQNIQLMPSRNELSTEQKTPPLVRQAFVHNITIKNFMLTSKWTPQQTKISPCKKQKKKSVIMGGGGGGGVLF